MSAEIDAAGRERGVIAELHKNITEARVTNLSCSLCHHQQTINTSKCAADEAKHLLLKMSQDGRAIFMSLLFVIWECGTVQSIP
jgi:hypothetical protein